MKQILFLTVFIFFLLAASTSAALDKTGEVDYDIQVQIDPITRSIEARSIITVRNSSESRLVLDRRYEVTKALIEGQPLEPSKDSAGTRHYSWHIPFSMRTTFQIEIHWHGKLSPLDTSLDHQQTLGRHEPVSGTTGTFLPKSSNWYPHIIGTLPRYRLKLELPPGQRGLVAGKLIEEIKSEQGYQAKFEFPFPSEGIDLMAGPYQIETDTITGTNGKQIQLRTYFHPQINDLAHDYLDAVKDYMTLYESWIGDYPFTEFSVVSSPTPSGFGMPTLTYLGINILRLPFIRATSLGHEVLHNWWGNGVYPDYQNGNWSEGLTTFMADYAYKEQESSEAAREMRLGWVRDFAALSPGQDSPLANFTSRTHGASKIVGYNKTAMLFFMLRDELGKDVFNRTIQALWTKRQFKVTSWHDLQSIFEMVSTKNLEPFFSQWLNRIGAPDVRIANVKQIDSDTDYRIAITLEQSEPTYQLQVPVVIHGTESVQTQVLGLQQAQQTFTLDIPTRPLSVSLDPNLRLFRQLASDEAPPILREIMVNQTTATILLPEKGELFNIAEKLAAKLQRRTPKIISAANKLPTIPILVIGLQTQIEAWLATHQLPAIPDIVTNKGSAQAWTLSRPDGATLALVSAQDSASLEALIRPLPHYGRQSYIAFDGAKAIERGTWPMRVQTVTVQ